MGPYFTKYRVDSPCVWVKGTGLDWKAGNGSILDHRTIVAASNIQPEALIWFRERGTHRTSRRGDNYDKREKLALRNAT